MEQCELCGCFIHRDGDYAKPTVKGRSHATKHHYIPERFFGRSQNRPGEQREPIFKDDPWGVEGEFGTFCYECHEELLHNPILLRDDIQRFAGLVRQRGLSETDKSEDRTPIAGRIKLLHEVVSEGLDAVFSPEED